MGNGQKLYNDVWHIVTWCAFVIIFMLFLFFLSGCAAGQSLTTPAPIPTTSFKYDLHGDVNGIPFNGVGVIPRAESYKINIKSDADMDLLTVTSCHRDESFQGSKPQWWEQPKRSFTYVYTPSKGIEDEGSCLVRLGSYNKSGDPNAWGLLDFESPEATLPATQKCNGLTEKAKGASICQSRSGLIQDITFDGPVLVSDLADQKCKGTSKDKLTWEYVVPEGECVVDYMEIAKPHRIHRHSSVGFKQIQIRGGN